MISEYAEKLKKEFDHLNEDYEKLVSFLEYHKDKTGLSSTLRNQIDLMVVQKAIMNAYLNILTARMLAMNDITSANTDPDEDDHK